MKYFNLLIGLQFFLFTVVFGQQVPPFETTIYFEDAIGNTDSVVVGYHPDANVMYNPDFGEEDISDIPWDSVFEVRGVHGLDGTGDVVLSKKIIAATENIVNSPCLGVENTLFFIHAKYQPVTISWDKSTFLYDDCLTSSFITMNQAYNLVDPPNGWWQNSEDTLYVCLAGVDSYELTFLEEYMNYYYKKEHQVVEGVDGDTTVLGVAYQLGLEHDFFSPCRHINTLVDVEGVSPNNNSIRIFPNPTSDYFFIEGEGVNRVRYRIYDVAGKLVSKDTEYPIDVQHLSKGMYFLVLENKGTVKFVKE